MYSFILCSLLLVLGYFIHGKIIEKIMRPSISRKTPAYTMTDGVDYVPMPTWKIFMIQFLNIAGTGPIFGAILGALYGPSCFLWITIGCIFIGSTHDYVAGMLSIYHKGENLPQIISRYLGNKTKMAMLAFSILLLLLVGAVFVYSPALILSNITNGIAGWKIEFWEMVWIVVILCYYLTATLVPIDKIIGKIYPIFSFAILFMAIGLLVCLLIKWPQVPEIWDGLQNRNPEGGHIFPLLFITIACGAISGFHATQSPLMARCMKNEKYGRPVFFGSMICEGLVALIWATISSYFFYGGGQADFGTDVTDAPAVVNVVAKGWLGVVGGILAMLGVVFAPITSGDTALRGARLIIADAFKLPQKNILKRLLVAIPIFIVTGLLLWFNISNSEGFNVIWRYFGWANQTLAVFTLWAITVYMFKYRKGFWYIYMLLPAAFMTSVSLTFILTEKIGFNLPDSIIPFIGISTFIISIILFYCLSFKIVRKDDEL